MRKQTLKAVAIASCAAATTAFVALPAFAADLGDNTTLGGQVFTDLSYINLQNDNSKGVPTETAPDGVGFDVKRLYLIVNHTFDDIWSANLTTDAQYATASTSTVDTSPTGTTSALTSQTTSGGVTEVYIKKLYLQGAFSKAFQLNVGSTDTAWLALDTNLYGNRWIEKTTTDRLGFANPDDWGAYASGSFDEGRFFYSVGGVDGGGYKNPTRTKFVDLDSVVGVKPVDWLTVGIGYYVGHLGQVTASNAAFPNHTASRLDGVIAFNYDGLRVGTEYFRASDYKTVNNTTAAVYGTSSVVTSSGAEPATDVAAGYSVWASYNFTPKWQVFARYDDAHLSEDVARALTDAYYNFGVSYEILKQLDVALVDKYERVTGGSNSISSADANSSYTIGGATATGSGTFREYGVYLQWAF